MRPRWASPLRLTRRRPHFLRYWVSLVLCVASIVSLPVSATDVTPSHVLDRFEDLSSWQVSASDDVKARLRSTAGSEGHGLCLEFDFGTVSGYAVVRRELKLEYGENYEFSFAIRGDAPPNTLQFKLLDASGENVWWVNRPDFVFPRDWERVRFKRRHLSFAWGPAQDQRLTRSAALEFVIVRGQGGGRGTVCFDELAFRELPVTRGTPAPPRVSATSSAAPAQPAHVVDGAMATVWRSDPQYTNEQTVTLDFGRPREFGGLVVHWTPEAFATRYAIDFSDDGKRWRTVREVVAGNGGVDPHLLTESETRYVRLRMHDGPLGAYGIAEIEIKDLEWGASPNAFFEALAKAAPRGHYPRAYIGEQSHWTVLGIDGGKSHGLLSEDGALEIAPQSPSIEPFLLTDGKIVTWADAEIEHALLEDYLPIPSVTWRGRHWMLHITAFAAETSGGAQTISHYTVENRTDRPRVVTLALAIRPFQVNPPTQFLNVPGGVTRLHALSWDGKVLSLNGEPRLYPLEDPDEVIAARFDAGNIPEWLAARNAQSVHAISDETGFASGVLLYRMELPPGGSRRVALVAPLDGAPALPAHAEADAWLNLQQANSAHYWRERLNRATLHLPKSAQHISNTLRTALAHVLASRAGPALQPGTRAYARSWVRDGAMMSDALSRLGHATVARDYIEWFAPHQFSNGKVPCCVDRRGSDPVAENDSHGAFIYLIAQHYRYSRDRARLQKLWPHVRSAAQYMNTLRLEQRTAENRTAERRAFYGLMPPSISHEGYSDKPAYSYWDDFWTLAGYDSAIDIARALGRDADVDRFGRQRDEFSRDLQASVRASIARHGIDFIPGSADRGDYDPTSTTIALSVAGVQSDLPQRALHATFERYWREFLARRESTKWDAYTPYELRNAGAFVRLGWRERVEPLLAFFLADRRPLAWNQWAEVVGREPRHPRFIGDIPHGWVASDYISAVLDQFAYERAADHALVLAAGIPQDWLADEGVGVRNLRTPHGVLNYRLRHAGNRLELTIDGGMTPPPGGLVFMWPYSGAPGRASVNGRPTQWERDGELRIRSLPAKVSVELLPPGPGK